MTRSASGKLWSDQRSPEAEALQDPNPPKTSILEWYGVAMTVPNQCHGVEPLMATATFALEDENIQRQLYNSLVPSVGYQFCKLLQAEIVCHRLSESLPRKYHVPHS